MCTWLKIISNLQKSFPFIRNDVYNAYPPIRVSTKRWDGRRPPLLCGGGHRLHALWVGRYWTHDLRWSDVTSDAWEWFAPSAYLSEPTTRTCSWAWLERVYERIFERVDHRVFERARACLGTCSRTLSMRSDTISLRKRFTAWCHERFTTKSA